ncbi:ankyrin repeat-containing domain protein [Syncephalis pseudoplumigaleata]|uniref:Ankyrin repeat-containing domain protein n=1 Tax=Syncephalis pseudoplumigaleata TaxID=1712513 RepID=A0A4P9YSW2_9FUNG|nr:ankyrin repeat-containing domain protein [Syncephalis pseudoplumigaleata]|eukprot:RKP22864.1 ankyrin repeat-containing domain protein [Syncephalis pseudoplumigaleata]
MTGSGSGSNIWIAAGEGDNERVQTLLANGINVNVADDHGYTALHAAASYDRLATIELLLQHGANVNCTDTDGDTPLFACETVQCAEALLAGGADAAVRNAEGKTAAEAAAEDVDKLAVSEYLRARYPATYDPANVTEPAEEDEEYQRRLEAMLQAADAATSTASVNTDESDVDA